MTRLGKCNTPGCVSATQSRPRFPNVLSCVLLSAANPGRRTQTRQHNPLATCQGYSRTDNTATVSAKATAQLELPPPVDGNALQTVARLASAWAELSRRLPSYSHAPHGSHFELIIDALKLSLAAFHGAGNREDGRSFSTRAVQVASALADLSAAGIPLDAETIAAGVLVEACQLGLIHPSVLSQRLGPTVTSIVHDIIRIRESPARLELYDDAASGAIREWCLAFQDVRANVVAVATVWDELQHCHSLPLADQQMLALEALQVFAPLGHALGLGAISAAMEDLSFQILFPSSYASTRRWVSSLVGSAEDMLFQCQQQLLAALDESKEFKKLADGCKIRARTKTLFSIMKKLLRLGDTRQGGRSREEIYDLLGLRAVVIPRTDVPAAQAEQLATQACYLAAEVAQSLWAVLPDRTKDYISQPKTNGYQSLHLTLAIDEAQQHEHLATPQNSSSAPGELLPESCKAHSSSQYSGPYLELQIRTQLMDDEAELGEAAHAAYKGGLDARQARKLQAWTQELQRRLATLPPHRKLLLASSANVVVEDRLLAQPAVHAALTPYISGSDTNSVSQQNVRVQTFPTTQQVESKDSVPTSAFTNPQIEQAQQSDANILVVGMRTEDATLAAQQLFAHMDKNKDGVISLSEIKQMLQELGVREHEGAAKQLMALLDENQDGGVNMDEFMALQRKAGMLQALTKLDRETATYLPAPQ